MCGKGGEGVSESSKRLFTMYVDCRRMAAGSYQRIPDHHSLPVASTIDAKASNVVSAATVPKRPLQNCVTASTAVSLLPLFQSDSCRTLSLHPLQCLCFLCSKVIAAELCRCTVHDCSGKVNFAATKLVPVFVATNILPVRRTCFIL